MSQDQPQTRNGAAAREGEQGADGCGPRRVSSAPSLSVMEVRRLKARLLQIRSELLKLTGEFTGRARTALCDERAAILARLRGEGV